MIVSDSLKNVFESVLIYESIIIYANGSIAINKADIYHIGPFVTKE
jgi:hypothetical protein